MNAPVLTTTPVRSRQIVRWTKRGLFAIVLLGGALLIAMALAPKPVPVDLVTATRGPMTVRVAETGRARVKDRYTVSAPVGGRVARIDLSPGDEVKAGQVVAIIVPMEAPLLDARSRNLAEAQLAGAVAAAEQAGAQLERARAARDFAATQTSRIESLWKEGVATRAQLDEVRLAQTNAEAELKSARFGGKIASHEVRAARAAIDRMASPTKSEKIEVQAPVDGRILEVIHESEGVVQASAPLFELGDADALEIVVDVLTTDAVRIARGAAVDIERWGGPPLAGRVRLIEPSAFTRLSALGVEEQRVNVIIDIESPRKEWLPLSDGFALEARIEVWKRDDVVQLPASAVFRRDEGWAVFRVEGDTAHIHPVEVGQRSGGAVEILAHLGAGHIVVEHPGDRVVDGVKVIQR